MKTPGAKRYFLRMAFGSLGAQKKRYFTLASGILLAIFFKSTLYGYFYSVANSKTLVRNNILATQKAHLLKST